MKIIGLTGPTGAGKTTVLRIFESEGAQTVDCDLLYHELLEKNADMLAELRKAFPQCFTGGKLDRKELGKLVFPNPELKLKLEEITHRYVLNNVRESIIASRIAGKKAFVVDAIALFESGFDRECDVTVGVLANRSLRSERIISRDDILPDYAEKRINSQKDDRFYIDRCDFILYNDGTREELTENARLLYRKILTDREDKK